MVLAGIQEEILDAGFRRHDSKVSQDIIFLDYSRTFETRYDLFYDTIHMNATGQKVLTEEIARQLEGVK